MTIPPTLTPRTIVNAIPRPVWWYNLFTTEPLTFASLDSWGGTVADLLDAMFDPTVGYDDLRWLREQWSGKLVVKGIQSVDDAAGWSTAVSTGSPCPTTAAVSSTGHRSRSTCCPDVVGSRR
jgi:isopentenyl diphosphate isomerase/L-lactate dehydrogenase-like FMN-dependent dehydrogenase